MDYFKISGGVALRGEYRIRGAKNAVLPIMAASAAVPGLHRIYDCPMIADVFNMGQILTALGARVSFGNSSINIDSRPMNKAEIPPQLTQKLRSSIFMMGSLLTRFNETEIGNPGGCRIGSRPVDMHIEGLRQMGFEVEQTEEKIKCRGSSRGGVVRLPYRSVGATENLMMAALSSEKETIIVNCAAEPEICDLQGFLNACGFFVEGAGTPEIHIRGKKHSFTSDTEYFPIEDRIEAATYMAAVLGTGGKAVFSNIRQELMEEVLRIYRRMGAEILCCSDLIEIKAPARPQRLKSAGMVVTEPFPGFPTDCQPQLISLCAASEGISVVREEIFESRFTHKKELVKMGANIEICGKNAIIKGNCHLTGATVHALDLRGGAALVLAGLFAEGQTQVLGAEHIDRGYQELEKGIKKLGGLIERRTIKQTKTEKEKI